MGSFKHILVPTDGSERAGRAVVIAAQLARDTGSKMTVAHVLAHSGSARIPAGLKEYARAEHLDITESAVMESVASDLLTRAADRAGQEGVKEVGRVILSGHVADEIVDWARENSVDLIVIGKRGLGTIRELLLGSVSHKTVQLAPCPTMVV